MEVMRIQAAATPDDAVALRIPMRDQIELAADLYLPAHDRPSPTVLIRTPYNKAKGAPLWDLPSIARVFNAHGYSVVAQDVRGKFMSQGATEAFKNEIDDGYDTLDWIANQDWNDGNIGMWGTSYFGFTQLAALASGHPALKCIAPRMTGTELGFAPENEDGCSDIEHAVLRWFLGLIYAENDMYMAKLDWSVRPLTAMFDGFFEWLGKRSAQLDASFEPGFADRVVPRDRLLSNPLPTLFTVGIYDHAAVWSWRDIDAMQRHPLWADKLFLRVEAIDHEGYSVDMVPMNDEKDHRKSPAARDRLDRHIIDPVIPFFNKHLRGFGEGSPKVVYQLGKSGWHSSETWPPLPSQPLRFYLDGDGPANKGTLSLLPVDRRIARWDHDPSTPVPSLAVTDDAPAGPGARSLFMEWPDLAPIGDRTDVMEFAAQPLAADLALAGPVMIRCMVGSTLKSADVFARLLDVAPDGRAALICRGHVRVPLAPIDQDVCDADLVNRLRSISVPLLHASYVVPQGHHMAVHLFSSDFPEYLFNPGDGSETWLAEQALQGTHMIEIGGLRGASITLTVAGCPAEIGAAFNGVG